MATPKVAAAPLASDVSRLCELERLEELDELSVLGQPLYPGELDSGGFNTSMPP